ncbi:MAG TPA: glucans biosynthesis glucosyltransferase MdoH [Casimicrobiaceae bacterium]|nr:glucans biosynthesis glucosyltransferase MdoH [Casimicrobiaceae bacterium]
MELRDSPDLSAALDAAGTDAGAPAQRQAWIGPASATALLVAQYVERLPLEPARRRDLVARALAHDGDAAAAMTAVHHALAGGRASGANAAYDSVRARVILGYGTPRTAAGPVLMRDVQGRERLDTTPPLARGSMAPHAWPFAWARRLPWRKSAVELRGGRLVGRGAARDPAPDSPDPRGRWSHAAARRRIVLLALVVAQTWLASQFMASVLPYHATQPLELAALVLFAILFGWISAGFWTAVAGFAVLVRGRDPYAISSALRGDGGRAPIAPDARTAIVMPICNEDVPRVFAGLRATYESLARTGALDRFDFFVLSDTANADTRVAEVEAWMALCRAIDGFGRVFYRWRQHRIKRKSGNIADFCRRWGRKYRYMVVLDADSVMTGECLTALVRMAEANPGAGIIQTAPRAAGRDTLYARVQQFATGAYGPLFTAGLHFWQLGESHYWGHNAIIRVAPFMRHCALGRLPGRGALSGEILSHDFVEAALMRRAGWAVWIAYDVPGSYEEMPPNLIDELSRDRRWCQGNLMNFRLFLMKGLHPAHRAVFMTGVMAYLSAPLWFAFLILSTALLAVHVLTVPTYFVKPFQLFPLWPQWHPEWAATLFSATALLLFLPKILAGLLIAVRQAAVFGGRRRMWLSLAGECALSALFAPIRMLFHTQFVLTALAGRSVRWRSPPRDDAETTWTDAVRRHGVHTLIGVAWATFVGWLNPAFLGWMLPVVGALILSVPLSVVTSRVAPGRRLRRRKYFLIPEEARPPAVIRATRRYVKRALPRIDFAQAVIDPVHNALACANGIARALPERVVHERTALCMRAVREGPQALMPAERATLIGDPLALSSLHFAIWTDPGAHPAWIALRSAAPTVLPGPWQPPAAAPLVERPAA